ncbi:MAG: hypothetical protein IPP15_20750 [Saprospiraceae bacterium]|uniref:Uncharacterized protein n=1 Tax=Candidatus Opimibacter skivensis TaxID=2982028 RepID=A0A9D7SZE2_9BACT|nr:hypothetical protein [Candidatus Opimibacter skivensis]
MTPKLRKIHRRVWRLMAILLPSLILIGAGVIPLSSPDKAIPFSNLTLLNKVVLGTQDGIVVQYGESISGQPYLEIDLTKVRESASSIATLSRTSYPDILLGKINSSGNTFFELISGIDINGSTLHIEDVLRHQHLYDIPLHLNTK